MNRVTLTGALFLGLLSCVLHRADALKCIQCEKCDDSSKMFEPKECSRIHLPEKVKSYAAILRLKEQYNTLDNLVKKATGDKIKTCFKSVHTEDGVVTLSRGCSPLPEEPADSCEHKKDVIHCMYVCPKDGCNSAPTFLKAGSITVSFFLAIAFFLL